jgi:hypothetical protein
VRHILDEMYPIPTLRYEGGGGAYIRGNVFMSVGVGHKLEEMCLWGWDLY